MDSVSVNAIASADLVLLPMVCEYFALQTLENMFRLIRLTRERVNPGLMYRLVVTRMDRQASLHEQVYARIKEHYDDALLESIIGVDIKLPESQLAGVPIHLYDSETHGVSQYRALTQEVVNLIKKDRPSHENHETN